MAIQLFDDDAAHVQSRGVETVSVPAAPEGGAVESELLTVTAHFAPLGAVTDVDVDPQRATQPARRAITSAACGQFHPAAEWRFTSTTRQRQMR
jgi:hypothetical protein